MKNLTLKSRHLFCCCAAFLIGINGSLKAQLDLGEYCEGAIFLVMNEPGQCEITSSGTNATAQYEGGYVNCVPGPDIFYQFNSGEYEAIQINLYPGTMDYAVLEVLDACGGSTIYCGISGDNVNTHIVQVEPNSNYKARVTSTDGPQGTFTICFAGIECANLGLNIGDPCEDGNPATFNEHVQENCECSGTIIPENDFCSDAIPLTVNGETVVANNTNATPDGPDMDCAVTNDNAQHDVWFSFVAPESGSIKIETSATDSQAINDTQIIVLDACSEDAAVLGCNDDLVTSLYALVTIDCGSYTPGATYYIQVDGYFNQMGSFNISITTEVCENDVVRCSDGIDNDGDGFIDCEDPQCQTFSNNLGCITCLDNGLSFADEVIEYNNTCPGNTKTNPSNALGIPNYSGTVSNSYVSLGQGGYIKLLFTNNTLTNSGNSDPDLHVFEVGPAVEAMNIELRPANANTANQLTANGISDSDGDGFYAFGSLSGASTTVDIDSFVSFLPANSLQFDAVKLVDVPEIDCANGSVGADIDGVCALSNLDQDASLNGQVNWNPNCGSRSTSIKLYEPGTTNLLDEYVVSLNVNGTFTINTIQAGTYDIFIKVDGYLEKGIPDVAIASGINSLTVGDITNGDVNNDNTVSIADVSLVNACFGSTAGNPNYNPLADLNCDGFITLIDLSILNASFGQIGA